MDAGANDNASAGVGVAAKLVSGGSVGDCMIAAGAEDAVGRVVAAIDDTDIGVAVTKTNGVSMAVVSVVQAPINSVVNKYTDSKPADQKNFLWFT